MKVTEEMLLRFLNWQLPKDFAPDCGITFKPPANPNHSWPVGTNLLTAIQARAMLEDVLATSALPEVAATPLGMVLVPKEMSEAMMLAWCNAGVRPEFKAGPRHLGIVDRQQYLMRYAAMLAALQPDGPDGA